MEPDATSLPAAEPVRARERVPSIDVLRGVALLGILLMNIVGMGMSSSDRWTAGPTVEVASL